MTTVKIHGVLAKKFGSTFKLNIGSCRENDVVLAIDSIKNNFRKTILDLSKKGFHYCLQKMGKDLFIVPCVSGSGATGKIIAAIILLIIAVVLTVLSAGAATPLLQFAYAALATIASAAGTMLLQQGMMENAMKGMNQQKYQSVGGNAMASQAAGKSYIFGGKVNLLSQGSNIPIGYGKFRCASNVIATSVKSYPTNSTFLEESSIDSKNIISLYD